MQRLTQLVLILSVAGCGGDDPMTEARLDAPSDGTSLPELSDDQASALCLEVTQGWYEPSMEEDCTFSAALLEPDPESCAASRDACIEEGEEPSDYNPLSCLSLSAADFAECGGLTAADFRSCFMTFNARHEELFTGVDCAQAGTDDAPSVESILPPPECEGLFDCLLAGAR